MNSAERLPTLDGLRATSIMLVLAAHMLPIGPKILEFNYTAGAMGMSLFFALSGFLITSTLIHNSNIFEFFVKRLARIIPLAYAYTFFVFTFVVYDPHAAVWTACFLINYFTNFMISDLNNHFWSLCVEVHFYLAIGLLVAVGQKYALMLVWPACIIITALRINDGAYIAIQTHLRVDEILVGACVATLYNDSWKGCTRYPTVLASLAGFVWCISGSPYAGWFQYFRPYATALLLASILCHGDTLISKILSSRFLRYIAAVSYALYVIHPLTIHGWFNQGSIVVRYLFKRPISLILTFAGAHVSTFYWEKFWIQMGRNWIRVKRMRQRKSAI